MSQTCRYLIMAGGTGGHIFPAMAVAKGLIRCGADIQWLGTPLGMERQLVPDANIPLRLVSMRGFRGKRLWDRLLAVFQLLGAVYQAAKVIRAFNPQVVIGFGGYVAAPGGIAARLLNKKLIIHEQNSVAGGTNKLLAKISSVVLEAFPGSLPNAALVGNPVREAIKNLYTPAGSQASKQVLVSENINLLIMGGSLGALAINTILPEVIHELPEKNRLCLWHQTGRNKLQSVSEAYGKLGVSARCEEFIARVEDAYQWADLIICRSGALTVSEIAVAGLPAIFIPYPHAIDNHQFTNALWLVKNNAAVMIEQSQLTVETLRIQLTRLLNQKQQLVTMSDNLKKLAMPEATDRVVAVCGQVCRGSL